MPPGVLLMLFRDWGGRAGKPTFLLILSRDIYLRIKLLFSYEISMPLYWFNEVRDGFFFNLQIWQSLQDKVRSAPPHSGFHQTLKWTSSLAALLGFNNMPLKSQGLKKKITLYWMVYISFINVWISAKSFIWELFQNIGVSVTNRSHSSGACVSVALLPWLNVFSTSFYLLWQTQSYHSLNIRTLKVLLTLWMVERLKRKGQQ